MGMFEGAILLVSVIGFSVALYVGFCLWQGEVDRFRHRTVKPVFAEAVVEDAY